ncbi:unnamed protein product [Amaranthus hypochondriacus]
MARGRGRPRMEVVRKRLSSSSASSKQSMSSSSPLKSRSNSLNSDPISEHEGMNPRSSLRHLQDKSLYRDWTTVVRGSPSEGVAARDSAQTICQTLSSPARKSNSPVALHSNSPAAHLSNPLAASSCTPAAMAAKTAPIPTVVFSSSPC